ncbi:hypothetical protein RR46_05852 [Papilio xuthus]|uniref:Uncharacterized protein n=1 Tax=Papilio xuthus TaxID=66420 RepID=A0A194PTY8_PAPXU|nr:hypothetical protein RR46_05852 [Papilio xuthus]
MAAVYFIAFFLLFVNCEVFADSTEQSEACQAVFNSTIDDKKCCEGSMWDDSDKSTKCKDDAEMPCDFFKCLAEENGLLVDDKINDKKVKELLNQWEKEYPSEKASIERVRRNCSGGKFIELMADSSASDDACEPLNFYLCVYINMIFECSSWKQDAQCSKMKEYTETCKKFLDI